MTKLFDIAKREIRKGTERYEISDLINLADKLQIDTLPPNTSAAELAEQAAKEVAREVVRARKTTFKMLLENRDRNRDGNPERDVLFSEVVAAIQSQSEWETAYTRGVANLTRTQFDVGIECRPIERIGGPLDSLPPCASCHVSKSNDKYLNFETWQIEPMCHDCAATMLRAL